jgi:hypothetical protein
MPTVPISAIPAIHPVRDPLQVYFQDPSAPASENSEPTELELLVQVQVGDSWVTVGEYLNPYSSQDTAGVLINRALLGSLRPAPPSLVTETLQYQPQTTCAYRLAARDIIGGAALTEFEFSDTYHGWLAGRSYLDAAGSYVDDKAFIFLTTQQENRFLKKGQRLMLPFLALVDSESVNVVIQINYKDQTQEIIELPLGEIESYKAYSYILELPEPEKELDFYLVSLTGFSSGGQGSIKIFIKKQGKFNQEVVYLNSMGGYDNFIFTGKSEFTHTDTGEVFESQLFPADVAQQGNYRAFNQKSTEGVILRTGWLERREILTLRDLTLRNEAYLVVNSQLRKILITNASYRTSKDGEFLQSLEISARFAFDNHSYTKV